MDTLNTAPQNFTLTNPDATKITIGFKASPLLKLRLSRGAQELNLTLSAYVEMIVSNFDKNVISDDVALLREKVATYECDKFG